MTAALATVGCGGDEPSEPAVFGEPIACLEDAGLVFVEPRGDDFWRGTHSRIGYLITVNEHASPREARALIDDAVGSYEAQAGHYTVFGPATISSGGLLDDDEGLEANRLVHRVAACLDIDP